MDFYIERYKGIEEKVYDCEVVTPLFMSGADQTQVEIRASSIKGLIRFWWRAHFQGSLDDMIKKEAGLFGSTNQKSKVELFVDKLSATSNSIKNLPPGIKFNIPGKAFRGDILGYLSFGLGDTKTNFFRNYIEPGSKFDFKLRFPKQHQTEIQQAVSALLAIGNLGSKSRNGFGSIHYPGNEKYQLPKLTNIQRKYLGFSNATRQYITETVYDSWDSALEVIGLAYGEARLSLDASYQYEGRKLLAKPIMNANPKITGRLSKPLFLHVRKEANNKYRGQITVFPTWPKKNSEKAAYNRMMEALLISFESNPSLKEVKQ